MPNEVRVHTSVDGNGAKGINDMKGAWEAFQKSGAKGLAIGTGIAAATAGFGLLDSAISTSIGFMSDSITKASDLNESMSKAEVIFGDNADAVEVWGATMDKAGGLSKQAALDAASGFAGLFKTVGLGIDQSTEMSEKLTQMGADLASFFNTDVGTAIDALKSGLNGESEPLRQFNVFLSETAVSAKLASMGVAKVGGSFTEAQKATARYQLILDQTGDAQGDFARTGDGLANSQRTLTAEIDNLQAEVGQELLPIIKDLTKWAKDEGVPALHGLFTEIHDGGGGIATIAQGFSDLERDLNGLEHNITGTGINIHRFFVDLVDPAQAAGDAAKAATEATVGMATQLDHGYEAAGDSAWTFARQTDHAADATKDVSSAARDARPHIKGIGGAAQKAADEFADLRKNVDAAADAIAEAAYGPEELRLAFAKNRLELKDNEDELGKVTAKIQDLHKKGKPVPRELRERFLDLKSSVVDNKEEIIKTGIKLKDVGGITLNQLQREFRDSHIDLSHLTGDAQALWSWLTRASNVSFNIGHGSSVNTHGHNASGGPVTAGKPTIVGENGPELFFPESSGSIMTNSNSMTALAGGGGGGPIIVQVMLDGREVGRSVATHVTKWQQDRRLLASR